MAWLLWLLPALPALALLAIHLGFRPPRVVEKDSPAALGLDFETVGIPTVRRRRLFGWLLPGLPAAPVVVIVHGWGGNAEPMLPLAAPFARAGYSVLLVDARGHGRSDGDTFSSLPRYAEDVDSAVAWVREHLCDPARKVVLLGHSVGAGAVLLAASRRRDIAAVISISAFAHPDSMMRRYLARLHLPRLLVDGVLRYVEWVIGHRFGEIAPLHTLPKIRCPVLLVHGRGDRVVPASDAEALARASGAELLLIDGAGHDSVEGVEEHGGELVRFLHRFGVVPRPGDQYRS